MCDEQRRRARMAMLALVFVTASCAVNPEPRPIGSRLELRVIEVEAPAPDFQITDPSSVEQLTALALVLADKGEFDEAASYFRRVARTQHNDFGERLLLAAAFSFLQADDRQAFADTMGEYRDRLGPERLAAAPPEVEVLLALEAYYSGRHVSRPPQVLVPILPSLLAQED